MGSGSSQIHIRIRPGQSTNLPLRPAKPGRPEQGNEHLQPTWLFATRGRAFMAQQQQQDPRSLSQLAGDEPAPVVYKSSCSLVSFPLAIFLVNSN